MISILHVIDTGGPGGAETVFLQTTTGLDPDRFRSTPVIGHEGWLSSQLDVRGVAPEIAPAKGSFNARYLWQLTRIAHRHRVNVIVAHLYGSAVYSSILGRLLAIPIVSVLHGQTDISRADRFASWKATIVRNGSHRVVFVSDRLREELGRRLALAPSQCVTIPNGVDTAVFRPLPDRTLRSELGLPSDAVLIGAIGNVRAPKAYDVLLRAARVLVDRVPRAHLVIAGDDANALGRELVELRDALGLQPHVTFMGLRNDVARILNNLDVYVLSSNTEGFSIACIEAMACGVPVVATRSGGPEEILAGDTGVLVRANDPVAIARAVESILTSTEFASRLVATALDRVHQEYSLGSMLARYEKVLSDVARRPRR